eukprot:827781-Prymnesium_polylepis.1
MSRAPPPSQAVGGALLPRRDRGVAQGSACQPRPRPRRLRARSGAGRGEQGRGGRVQRGAALAGERAGAGRAAEHALWLGEGGARLEPREPLSRESRRAA